MRSDLFRTTLSTVLPLLAGVLLLAAPAPARAGSDVIISDIWISPSSPEVGDSVTVYAMVTNQGDSRTGWGSFQIAYYLDGVLCDTDSLTLGLGAGADNEESTGSCNPSTSGSHTIRVVADSGYDVSEDNESNNARSETFYWSAAGQPDLVVSDISISPSSPQVGDSVTVTATLENQGPVGTGVVGIDIAYYLDGSLCDTDVLSFGLGAYGSDTESTGSCEPTTAGSHTIRVVIDTSYEVAESNEGNNSRSESFYWSTAAEPDLVVTDISISPSSPVAGESVSVTATLRNQGDAGTGFVGIDMEYYLDGWLCDTDVLSAGLGAGSSDTESTSSCVPTTGGWHEIEVVIDTDHDVAESNEGNNSYSDSFYWSDPAEPDLIVSDIDISPDPPRLGEGVTITATLTNQGDGGTSAVFDLDYYVDGVWCDDDALSFGLGAGDSDDESTSSCAPVTAGCHDVRVVVDVNDEVDESNEGNNSRTETFCWDDPAAPDLIVQAIAVDPDPPRLGEGASITATLANIGDDGTGFVSVDLEYYLDGWLCDTDALSAGLGAGATNDESTSSCVPDTAGCHEVTVVIDTQYEVAESNEGNNERSVTICWEEAAQADLVVDAIAVDPDPPTIGETATITATLANVGNAGTGVVSVDLDYYLDGVWCDSDAMSLGLGAGSSDNENTTACAPATAGCHEVTVVVDANFEVAESNEGNNERSVTICWQEGAQPDLVVQAIAVDPDPPRMGETATITATLANIGDAGTGLVGVDLDYYLDGVWCDSDVMSLGLGAGASDNEGTTACVPDGPGCHEVTVVVDSTSEIAEGNEGNNERSVTVCWQDAAQPDLTVDAIAVAPDPPVIGETATITATLANIGDAGTGLVVINLTYELDGVECATDALSLGLGAGATNTEDTTACAPTTAGCHVVAVTIDTDFDVAESNETNNRRERTICWGEAPQPDLVVQAIAIDPVPPVLGESATITATFANTGAVGTGIVGIGVRYEVDGVECDTDVLSFGLGAGATDDEGTSACAPVSAGCHEVAVVIDTDDEVAEANENNNRTTATFCWIQGDQPDLVVQAIEVDPDPPVFGETATVTATLANIGAAGTGLVSVDLAYYLEGVLCDTDALSFGLGAGASDGESTTACAPETPGCYELAVEIDTEGEVAELDETNNRRELLVCWGDAPQPDLVVDRVVVEPALPVVGEAARVTATLANVGSVGTGLVSVPVRFALDGVECDVQALSFGLGAGATNDESTTACNAATAGPHTLEVTIDPDNVVAEENDGNNAKSVFFQWVDPPRPDLIVQSIELDPPDPEPNDPLTVTATFENQGPVGTGWVSIDIIYYLDGQTCDTDALTLGLGSGATNEESTGACVPRTPGPHEITVAIDTNFEVVESDETNNTLSLPFTAGEVTPDCPAECLDQQAFGDEFDVPFAGLTSPNGLWRKGDALWECDIQPGLVDTAGGAARFTVPAGGAECAQIGSTQSDFFYGSYRASIRTAATAGVCGAFFFQFSDSQEIDVEILSRENAEGIVHFVSHPNDADCGAPSHQCHEAGFDPSAGFHEYGFDWYPDRIELYVDGARVGALTRNIPTTPGRLFLSNWGAPQEHPWTGAPPAADAVMAVEWVSYTPFDLCDVCPGCGNGVVTEGEDCDLSTLDGATCQSLGYAEGTLACGAECVFDEAGCSGVSACGNGAIDTGEECDGDDLGGQSCASIGFTGGALVCGPGCDLDTSGCTGQGPCGNGVIDPGEDCDGGELGGQTCESLGYAGGALACDAGCDFDPSGCGQGAFCGNGVLDDGEECDGADLGGQTCEGLGLAPGALGCTADCDHDTVGCGGGGDCGNGVVDPGEDCDQGDLNGQDCASLGLGGGMLACDPGCDYDLSGCDAAPACGNGTVDGGEECDDANLDGWTCELLGFEGGTLVCDAGCDLDTSGCSGDGPCGNGVIDPGEECDGDNTGGKSCLTLGFSGGTLACDEGCDLDASGCSRACGNGTRDLGEECDGADLGGQDCASLGLGGGTLACADDCDYDLSGCDSVPACGNGVRDPGEDCDGADLGGQSCRGLGLGDGTLACDAGCDYDPSACATGPACGNGIREPGEDCDGANLGGATCLNLGFASGTLVCSAACDYDTSDCVVGPRCGDGNRDPGEDCDGGDLGGATCESIGLGEGTLACTPGCDFELSGCGVQTCGDGERNTGEDCDGEDLGGQTCASLGLDGGTLACTAGCDFDTSGCGAQPTCGDGVQAGAEDCDGADLGGQTCAGLGYAGGTLACTGGCAFDTTGCSAGGCGDGVVDTGEDCDGANLGGATCASLGFDGGDLACSAACDFDTSGCETAPGCGDGWIDEGEDCDGDNLGGRTCATLGYDGGSLACTADCEFDPSGCEAAPGCGDGVAAGNEACDGADLRGGSCAALGYAGGTLGCTDTCRYDESGCEEPGACGDGAATGDEACDGADLRGASCADMGFADGDLACAADCTLDTTGCRAHEPKPDVADDQDGFVLPDIGGPDAGGGPSTDTGGGGSGKVGAGSSSGCAAAGPATPPPTPPAAALLLLALLAVLRTAARRRRA